MDLGDDQLFGKEFTSLLGRGKFAVSEFARAARFRTDMGAQHAGDRLGALTNSQERHVPCDALFDPSIFIVQERISFLLEHSERSAENDAGGDRIIDPIECLALKGSLDFRFDPDFAQIGRDPIVERFIGMANEDDARHLVFHQMARRGSISMRLTLSGARPRSFQRWIMPRIARAAHFRALSYTSRNRSAPRIPREHFPPNLTFLAGEAVDWPRPPRNRHAKS